MCFWHTIRYHPHLKKNEFEILQRHHKRRLTRVSLQANALKSMHAASALRLKATDALLDHTYSTNLSQPCCTHDMDSRPARPRAPRQKQRRRLTSPQSIARCFILPVAFELLACRLSMAQEKACLTNTSRWMTVSKSCKSPHEPHKCNILLIQLFFSDYNTRFSGLSADIFTERAKLPLASIRRLLGALIDENTVLVGHGLENDLKALRMIHPRVIDTIALFPHAQGYPYRRSLRDLCVSLCSEICLFVFICG